MILWSPKITIWHLKSQKVASNQDYPWTSTETACIIRQTLQLVSSSESHSHSFPTLANARCH